MCLRDLENGTFSIPIFHTIIHPSVHHFSKERHTILLKLHTFYYNLLKIQPIYVIWAPSLLMKTHRSLYQILQNSVPKGRHIIRIPCQCETVTVTLSYNRVNLITIPINYEPEKIHDFLLIPVQPSWNIRKNKHKITPP